MKLFRKREDPKVCEMVHFVYEHARLSRRNKRYKCTYRVLAKHLTQFEESRGIKLMSNSFNVQVAEDFIYYMNNKGLMLNTIRGYYDKVKYMLRRMSRMGFEVDFSFEHVIIKDEETNAIYITSDEIRRIAELKIRGRERDVVRDRFVCNCLTGFRYGDFSKLTAANIKGNVIFRKTEKKGAIVEVPIHPIVRKILDKYNGNFPYYEKSQQNYNVIIKKICKQVGITDKVLWERTVGGKVVRKTFKRYELVSSHTARRSFATNAYLAGIPTARIMLITGHKTEDSFFKYIRISRSENAKLLADHPFFN